MLKFTGLFNSSIYYRLLGSFGIIILSILVVGILNYYQLTQFRALSAQAIPGSVQIAVLQDYALALSSLDTNLERLFVIGGGEIEEEILLNLIAMEEALSPVQAISGELLPATETLVETTRSLKADTQLLIALSTNNAEVRQVNEQIITVFDNIDLSNQLHEDLSTETLNQVQNIIISQETIVTGMINQVVMLAIVASLIAILASLFVSRSIAVPLREVAQIAKQITAGQLSDRASVRNNDEIGQLATSFNTMADTIQTREQDLIHLNQSLEARVQRRTLALEEKTEEALEANRLKDEFLATMSHELRTPLNAIIGFTGILKMQGALQSSQVEFITRIRSNADRLLNLINDILDISRIESGKMQIVEEPLNLPELVQRLETQTRVLAEAKNLAFNIDLDASLPDTIYADEDIMIKIVSNLLSNAVKFTSEGRVDLRLQKIDADVLKVEVTDTGTGIPLDKQELIFDRFRQIDASIKRQYGGSGLGLALVKHLTDLMGGQIHVDSVYNQGSTFTLLLPVLQSKTPPENVENKMEIV